MAFRSGNPALNVKTFENVTVNRSEGVMTLEGTVNKIGILLITVVVICGGIMQFAPTTLYFPLMITGAIGALIMGIVTTVSKVKAPVTAPVYAVFEGLFLGGISSFANALYPGVVTQAVLLTFGVFFSLLVAYKSGLIKPTENFKLGLSAAIGGISLLYLTNFIMSMFGHPLGIVSSNSLFSIGLSVVIVAVAAFTLVLDFDFIEDACDKGAPKYMEWYGAYGLLVSLVWLYVEILRLLMKLQSRR